MDFVKDSKLPVLDHFYSDHRDDNVFHDKILFAIQPLFYDSYQLLMALKNSGLEIFLVIGLEYSSKTEIKDLLIENKVNCIVRKSNEVLETVKAQLLILFDLCKKSGKQLLILENGGFIVPTIHEYFADKAYLCIGAVEETKQGLWKDQNIENLLLPILQTADTDIKKIESGQLGEPVVTALFTILKKMGLGLQGKKIGVLGYGWIGSSIARSLKMRSSHVLSYDINPIKNIEAYYNGCLHGNKDAVLAESDIIIGASGQTSIKGHDFFKLKSGVFIASASSKTIEFDLHFLNENSNNIYNIGDHIKAFCLKETNNIVYLLSNGEPINFLVESMPNEIMDLMMANMYLCLVRICSETIPNGIQPSNQGTELAIANIWLRQRNIF